MPNRTDLALRLVGKLANYSASAAIGALLAGGGEGVYPVASLLSIAAAGLVVDTGADHLRRDASVERVATALEELLRRHRTLEQTVSALASGRESHPEIDRYRAETLLAVLRTPSNELAGLAQAQGRMESLLIYIGQWLAHRSDEQLRELIGLVEQLPGLIQEGFAGLKLEIGALRDEVRQRPPAVLAFPSAEQFEAEARDDEHNSQLRAERLRAYLDAAEVDDAATFARHCEEWLGRVRSPISPAHRVRLLEAITDAAIAQVGSAEGSERASLVAKAAGPADQIQSQLDRLEPGDRLRASSLVAYVRSHQRGTEAGLAAGWH